MAEKEYIERSYIRKMAMLEMAYTMETEADAAVVLRMIEDAPAADVGPAVHGRWVPCDPDSDVRFYCSECETEISTSWDYDQPEMWNFCPNCGADMNFKEETPSA